MNSGLEAKPPEADDFKRAAGQWATGCAVITTCGPAGPTGVTMSAVTSLSLRPMQFLICLDRGARTLAAIRNAGVFAINILSREQKDIAVTFAGKAENKFVGVGHRLVAPGVPVIDGVLAAAGCSVARIVDGGDHEIVIGDVKSIELGAGEPLLHYRGSFGRFAPATI